MHTASTETDAFIDGGDLFFSRSEKLEWRRKELAKERTIKSVMIGEDRDLGKERVRWHRGQRLTDETDSRHTTIITREMHAEWCNVAQLLQERGPEQGPSTK